MSRLIPELNAEYGVRRSQSISSLKGLHLSLTLWPGSGSSFSNNLKRLLLLVSVLVGAAWVAQARPLTQNFTSPVTEDDGDVIVSTQVFVSSLTATLIDVGTSSNTYNVTSRRRILRNVSVSPVFIGISTPTLVTTGFQIDSSTNPFNNFQTYNTAPIYGMCNSGNCTVDVLKESSANP